MRGSRSCALDVLGDYPPFRARSAQAGQIDAALARDPPRQRRRLDPTVRASRLLLLGLLLGRLAPSLALLLARRSRRPFLLLVLVDLDRGLTFVGDLLALLADHRDPLADLDLLTLAREDLQEHAARVGLDLLRDLVRVELVERLALFDLVPFRLEPADDRSRFHALPEPRKRDVSRHSVPPFAGSPRAPRPGAGRRTPPSPARTEAGGTSPPRARPERRASRRPGAG